jgi:hypothetical protein
MRIHSDVLSLADIQDAITRSGAFIDVLKQYGSKSRARAFEVKLFGESPYWTNSGERGAGAMHAASYDQWGIMLAILFGKDSDMKTPYYTDNVTFHNMHAGRYLTLTKDQTHARHNWKSEGNYLQTCTCGASRDWSAR